MSKTNNSPFVFTAKPKHLDEKTPWGAFFATVSGRVIQEPVFGWGQSPEGVIVPLVQDYCYGGGFVPATSTNSAKLQYVEVRPYWDEIESFVAWGDDDFDRRFGSAPMFAALRLEELNGDHAKLVQELAEHWAPQDVIRIVSDAGRFGAVTV